MIYRESKRETRRLRQQSKLGSFFAFQQEETRRRYENTLTQVKYRAVELSSPRPIESLVSLADFSQIPSETPYVSTLQGVIGSASSKKCKLCETLVSFFIFFVRRTFFFLFYYI